MRRLFWTFPDGLPGAGLLLMRCVTGVALLARCVTAFRGGVAIETDLLQAVLSNTPAVLLLAGLWTPIAGGAVTLVEVWRALFQPGDQQIHILIATLGAALALIGPGAWSADASLFGWTRIDVPERRDNTAQPR